MYKYSLEDTIIGLSTSNSGKSAIALLRVSGDKSLQILQNFCFDLKKAKIDFHMKVRKALLCYIIDKKTLPNHHIIDKAIVIYYKAPHSYTAQDMIEFSLHGNMLIVEELIQLIIKSKLARLAEPGEFTKRAFLMKKISLSEAEAVRQIIDARTVYELGASRKNLYGDLQKLFSRIRSRMIHLKAENEANLDFSTEDLSYMSPDQKKKSVRTCTSF